MRAYQTTREALSVGLALEPSKKNPCPFHSPDLVDSVLLAGGHTSYSMVDDDNRGVLNFETQGIYTHAERLN